MRRISFFFIFAALLILPQSLTAQYSLNLTVLGGLNTIDFAAFTFTNDLSGTPRIFQMDIVAPAGKKIVIGGNLSWQKDGQSGFIPIVNSFFTRPFTLSTGNRTIFNDQLGGGDILFDQVDGNQNIADEILKKGKPSGVYRIQLYLFDDRRVKLYSSSPVDISFLNPAPTLSILNPRENNSYDVGNVQAQWTPVLGATNYIIRACALQNAFQSPEEALSSGSPLINDKNVGKVETVNLSSILDRQWVGGQKIVLLVTAFVTGPGGGSKLPSPPVIFRLNESGSSARAEINPDLVRLGNLLSGKVSQDFVTKLLSGQIPADEIKITDDKNKSLSFSEFQSILAFWELHRESIISINYLAK
ncbi:MAG: hypothetical protein CVV24_05730 [Ignavibacteriae bacterium HGW-Ignavibacteriae-3]|nr:MAG: hypothetical protein CVV24_05730 [Ignavibacteriae bacterium HGW-Ignavibacteriae-3]